MPNDEREFGRFEGKVLQHLTDLDKKLDEMRSECRMCMTSMTFKIDTNTKNIERQKGWLSAIGVFAGFFGSLVKGWIFDK